MPIGIDCDLLNIVEHFHLTLPSRNYLTFFKRTITSPHGGCHTWISPSIKREISEPKHGALLLLQHISLSDSARIATVAFATRLFNAPAFAMPRGIPLWPLTCFRNDVWKIGINVSETVQIGQSAERAFPTVALGGSDPEPGARLRTGWQPAALGGQGTLRRAKHNW